MKRDLLTSAEAGRLLQICRHAVNALIRRGKLPAERYGNRYLIERGDLEKIQWQRKRKNGRPNGPTT